VLDEGPGMPSIQSCRVDEQKTFVQLSNHVQLLRNEKLMHRQISAANTLKKSPTYFQDPSTIGKVNWMVLGNWPSQTQMVYHHIPSFCHQDSHFGLSPIVSQT